MKNFIRLLLILIIYSCIDHNFSNIKKEELQEKFYVDNYKRIDLLTKKYSKKGLLDSAIFYTNELLEIALKEKDSVLISNAYFKKGLYFKKKTQLDSAYFWYKKSVETSLAIKDSLNIAKRFSVLAKIESKNELYFESDSSAIQGLRYTNDTPKFNKIVCTLYNNLGINARNQEEYNESISYYNLAIKKTNDSVRKIRYKANKAVVYKYKENYKKSIDIYNDIIRNKFFNKIDSKLKFKILDNYVFTKFLAGRRVNVNDFFKVQSLKDSIGDYKGLITNYSYLSAFFAKMNLKKSLLYANKMYDLSKKNKSPNDELEAIDKILRIVQKSKFREFALRRNILKDSIINAQKKSKNKLVKTIYNFEELKKQKLIAESNFSKEKTKRIEEKSQKQRLFFFIIITSVAFISYIFYRKQAAKKEKIIEVYKTETRLAKKIHDELANDVYLAMNKLQNNKAVQSSELLVDLDKIYKQTRDISHENSPVVTGEKFQEFLQQLFIDFSTDECKIMNKGLSEIQVNKLTKEKQIVMYRVLQELLVNMKKHSQANLVVIAFEQEKDKIRIRYKDNGVGTNFIASKNGLKNMETRMQSIGGTITFDSEKQKGFQAKFQFKK